MNNENIHPNITFTRGEPKEQDGTPMDRSFFQDRSMIMTPMDDASYQYWSNFEHSKILSSSELAVIDKEFDRRFATPTTETSAIPQLQQKGTTIELRNNWFHIDFLFSSSAFLLGSTSPSKRSRPEDEADDPNTWTGNKNLEETQFSALSFDNTLRTIEPSPSEKFPSKSYNPTPGTSQLPCISYFYNPTPGTLQRQSNTGQLWMQPTPSGIFYSNMVNKTPSTSAIPNHSLFSLGLARQCQPLVPTPFNLDASHIPFSHDYKDHNAFGKKK